MLTLAKDLSEIKKRIFNEDKIEDLFESMGCQKISFEQSGTLITAMLPDRFGSSNQRAVQCRVNEGLSCVIRNRPDFSGDIFNLVSYLALETNVDELQSTLNKSKEYICKTFGWQDLLNYKVENKPSILSNIKSMRHKDSNRRRRAKPNRVINENLLNDFINIPIKSWVEEGINHETQMEYKIGFDLLSKRITIPVRNRFGELVGVKGRILLDSDITESIPKYQYIYKCNQSQEWFNLHNAIGAIRNKKEVIIVEGEKSCMKFYQNGIYNVVAIGSSSISEFQRDIIYSLGRDINVVLAYDSDRPIDEVQTVGEMFEKRSVQMIYDRDKILGKKMAPIDLGIEKWNKLYSEYIYDLN